MCQKKRDRISQEVEGERPASKDQDEAGSERTEIYYWIVKMRKYLVDTKYISLLLDSENVFCQGKIVLIEMGGGVFEKA